MASVSHPSESFSFASFRAAIPCGPGAQGVADKLCAIGQAITLSPGVELPSGDNEHRLVYIASGAAKLLVQESPGTPRAGPATTQ